MKTSVFPFRCTTTIRIITTTVLAVNILFVAMINYNEHSARVQVVGETSVSAPVSLSSTSPKHQTTQQTVHVALVVGTVEEARDAGALLKTLVFSRRVALLLHIVVNEISHKILKTLLSTWEEQQVDYHLYKRSKDFEDRGLKSLLKFKLISILPPAVDKVIYVDNKLRLLGDVGELWKLATNDSKPLGLVSTNPGCNDTFSQPQCIAYNIIIYDMKSLRNSSVATDLSAASSQAAAESILMKYSDSILPIDCSWGVELGTHFDIATCLNYIHPIRGLVPNNQLMKSSEHLPIEAARDAVLTILSTQPASQFASLLSVADRSRLQDDRCAEFRYVARLKRRTHLYFDGDLTPLSTGWSSNDVTMATQLTADRLTALERMLDAWDGPASVAFHVTDEEALRLPEMIRASKILRSKKKVAYHVVYKRLAYGPINYLRNVAVNNSLTPFTLFVDVDLVPSRALYESLKQKITQQNLLNNITLIVPSFEAFSVLPTLPTNKSELLQLIAEDKVVGYRMKRGWNLGHKPTNFSHWQTAKKPYDVTYHDAFEPYLVVRSDIEQRFHERLLERMADKAMYTRWLHAASFKLRVLPDVFLVHLPHPSSPVLSRWMSLSAYGRCATIISEEVKRELQTRYPSAKF